MNPFAPTGSTVTLAATDATGNVALGALPNSGGGNVMVTNAGPAMVFVAFGGSSAIEAETTTGIPVLAGSQVVFSVGPSVTHIAALTASSAATIYVTPGMGV